MIRINKNLKENRSEHYYVESYDDYTVADLLLTLEDENFHTCESLVEAMCALDSTNIVKLCEILIRQHENGGLSDEDYELRKQINKDVKEN